MDELYLCRVGAADSTALSAATYTARFNIDSTESYFITKIFSTTVEGTANLIAKLKECSQRVAVMPIYIKKQG